MIHYHSAYALRPSTTAQVIDWPSGRSKRNILCTYINICAATLQEVLQHSLQCNCHVRNKQCNHLRQEMTIWAFNQRQNFFWDGIRVIWNIGFRWPEEYPQSRVLRSVDFWTNRSLQAVLYVGNWIISKFWASGKTKTKLNNIQEWEI